MYITVHINILISQQIENREQRTKKNLSTCTNVQMTVRRKYLYDARLVNTVVFDSQPPIHVHDHNNNCINIMCNGVNVIVLTITGFLRDGETFNHFSLLNVVIHNEFAYRIPGVPAIFSVILKFCRVATTRYEL